MNKIYRLKFDRKRNELVVVSELMTGAGKDGTTGQVAAPRQGIDRRGRLAGTLTPLALMTGLIVSLLPGMVLAAPALPAGGQIIAGQGSITTQGQQMTIHQQTQHLATNWQSFDIGKNNTVQFVQPDSSAVALNRVTGSSGSQIMGSLKANGQVFILNPNGVLFGRDAKVNVAGLVASTKHLDTADFMRGQYTLSGRGVPGAQVINQGSLTTAEGGFIVLAADRVSNTGRVTTPSGKTVLAAAERVTLQLDNGGLTSVSVSGDVVNALVENRGLLSATDGQVYLTARGKDMLLSTVVNNSGTVEARGLQTDGGVIRLDGGDSGVVRQAGQLLADSAGGRGGDISVEGQNIHLAAGSLTSATGSTGGGRVRVGGGWQGKDQTLRNASGVVMDTTATVDVSATQHGDGGTAVLWSEDYTDFRGTVRATGGAQSGNGGRVETSSHRNLQAFGQVDASAARGQGGEWLLDPTDVTIVGTGTTSGVTESGKGTDASLDVDIDHLFTPSASGAQILNTSIESQLNSGTNVVVQTSGSDVAGQAGNITVSANISKTAGADASLTLKADGNITLTANTGISSTAGKLDISLLGAGSDSGMVNITRSTLNSNGGNITIDQLNHSITGTDGTATVNPNAMTVKIDGGTLNATAGNVTVNAYNPNVNLSQPAYASTVRNSGSMVQVSGNSTLSGENILLHTTLDGGNAVGLPVFLNGANLTANHNITLKSTLNPVSVITTSSDGAQTTTTTSPSAFSVELRGAGNVLTATAGNITITNNAAGSGNGIFLNGTTASKATLTAGGDITLNGSSVSGYGVGAVNACLTAAGNITVLGNTTSSTGAAITGSSLNATGSLVVTGNSASGAGLQVSGSALAGSRAALTGSSRTGGTGFSLTNTTLAGNLADLANVTLSSQDSGAGAINVLDSKVVTSASRDNLLKKKIENMTTVDMGGTSIFDDTTNATKGWTADYTHADLPNSGWIFSNTTATAAGDISLKGVGFINATLNTTNGGISITSAGNTILTSTTLNATKDVALNAGLNLTLSQVNVTTAGNISLLGAGSDSGMVNITRSTLNSNGGNITIDQLNHSITGTDGTATVNPNAMTVKIDGGTLNATAGNVTVNAYNPNVNLSQPAYASTVRNSGSMVQVSGNSTLSGENILLHTTLDGGNAVGLPVFLNGANLTANHNITLKSTLNPVSITTTGSDGTETTTTTSPAPASIELRGAGNTLTATAGNITITNNAAGGSNGIFLNGTTASKATLTAGRDITLNGSSASGTGLLITNATLNGSRAALTGSSRTGGTGFSLTNTTLAGNLADLANVTLSSHGSAAGAINVLDRSVVSDDNRDNLLKKKIENMTTVDMNGSAIFDDTDKTDKGWTKDFTSADTPNGGWTFNNTTVRAGGDVNLKGAAFSNSNITVSAGNLTLDNVGATNLSGSNITVSNGGVSVHSSAGSINANSANVTADRDISLLADKDYVSIWTGKATSTNGNITLSGTMDSATGSGISIGNTALTALNGTITLNGSGSSAVSQSHFDTPMGVITIGGNTALKARKNIINAVSDWKPSDSVTLLVNPATALRFDSNVSLHLTGDSDITAQSASGAGVFFVASKGGGETLSHVMVFDGSLNLNASSGDAVPSWAAATGAITFQNYANGGLANQAWFALSNASVSIVADASASTRYNVPGFAASTPQATGGSRSNGFIFTGAGDVAITGKSYAGDGVNARYFDNTGLTGSFSVTGSSVTGTGVNFDRFLNTNLVSATVTGSSASGAGVLLASNSGSANLNGNTVTGTSATGQAGVQFTGKNVTLTNGTLSGTVTSGNGSGVVLTGGSAYTLDGATVTGTSVNGTGVSVSGSLALNNNASLAGNATGTGSGVSVKGNLSSSGGVNISGTATTGDGVVVAGDTTLANATLSGQTDSGAGVNIAGNLTTDSSTQVAGKATDGTGVKLGAALSGANVTGVSGSGAGVQLADHARVTGAVLNGTSDSGSGVAVTGDITLDDTSASTLVAHSDSGSGLSLQSGTVVNVVSSTTSSPVTSPVVLNGTSVSGSGVSTQGDVTITGITLSGSASDTGAGVTLGGNLTLGDTLSGVNATTANGTAIVLDNVTLNAAAHGDSPFSLNASATGNGGTAIKVTGNSALTNTALNGQASGGSAVVIDGKLTTDQSVSGSTAEGQALTITGNGELSATGAVTGAATGGGTGVVVNGTVSSGTVSGTSVSGTGAQLGDGADIAHDSAVSGTSTSGTGAAVSGSVSNAGTVTGTSVTGNGADITGTVTGSGAVSGTAQGNGSGVTVSGKVDGGSVSGQSESGTGAQVNDGATIASGTVSGKSDTGTGAAVSGNVSNTGNISGTSTSGNGADITGVVTGSGAVIGTAQGSGSGVTVSGKVDGGSVSGTSASGTGAQVSNGANIASGSVSGKSESGAGAVVSGSVSSHGSITGQSVSGDGLTLNASVSGSGTLSGTSVSGAGAHVDGSSHLDGGHLSGTTSTGVGMQVDGNLTHSADSSISSGVQPGGSGSASGGSGSVTEDVPPGVTPPDALRQTLQTAQQATAQQQTVLSQMPASRSLLQRSGYQAPAQQVDIDVCQGDQCSSEGVPLSPDDARRSGR